MAREINLLVNYPQTKRDPTQRAGQKDERDQEVARRFGRDFFDGDRRHGYGGFSYQPRFWQPVVPTFRDYWGLSDASSLLDVGCAKGFMLYDIQKLIPGITVAGVDISRYAIENAKHEIKSCLQVADATSLPFADNSFDVVVSINTVHNLDQTGCAIALLEIERVARHHSFVMVDAYRNEQEQQRMMDWNLTALTVMHVDEWKAFFFEVGYTGDYSWFIP